MKLDFDLIREIMEKINESTDKIGSKHFFSEDNTISKVTSHIEALIEGEYIKADKTFYIASDYPEYEIERLTLKGYDFFSEIKNKTIWEQIKTIAEIKKYTS